MRRASKVAICIALATAMLAVAIRAVSVPAPPQRASTAVARAGHEANTQQQLRCASITIADPACEAAWAEARARFFGSQPQAHAQ